MSKDNKTNLKATFKAGDSVLCPSLSVNPFVLSNNPRSKRDLLSLTHDGSYFYYDNQGYFVPSCDKETGDYQPSLFHNTPANRAALATLYFVPGTTSIKLIDVTDHDDDEVILMSSCMLSDTACEVLGAAEVMHDIGQLLYLIYNEAISPNQAQSMARLVHDTTDRWHGILYHLLDTLNKPLEQTAFGKVEG
ncbi:hypothetical protein [Psychrobacter pacificensis]|uniref:hypothetical protein n=1 Tax=Psychrobacter pacificensis TaxID=112002 RepID=UPI001CBC895C|nr:hypothetical protein [Psychrobacter pacificensis]MBZ1392682.1 hypothetical protein [Psychrobacter pacificensis]|tara:strand:+ start:459 stop:1034 length:576 start_codon:yes stop_codon:yes gene_type:complete